jgi:hypothetical protein
MGSHYAGLIGGYAAAVAGWWLLSRLMVRFHLSPASWNGSTAYTLEHPWREISYALIGVVGVLLVGQMWSHGWKLPATGTLAPLIESVNQFLIFLPILLVPLIRRHGARTLLLPSGKVGWRLLAGLILAFAAIGGYTLIRSGSGGLFETVSRVVQFQNLDEAVQVLMEDLAIGIFLYRLAAALGARRAVVGVAALFALGHIPALISGGATAGELSGLIFDFALGVAVVGVILRSGDILWFWPVHVVMDLMQFSRISGN